MALDSYIWRIYKQTNEHSNAIQEYEERERYASFKPRCFTKRFGDIFLLITNNVDVFLINSDTKYKL